MKILIVSGQKFSKTNRSIDTITEYFIEKNHQVEHLVLGINKLKNIQKIDTKVKIKNFKQLYSEASYFAYLGIMGRVFPEFILNFIKNQTIKTAKFINFSKYDLIILETGKSLFLMDIIPKNISIICRQSDPLEISIRSNRKYFREMEKKAFERSIFSLIAHKKSMEEYKELNNLIEWKSGFEIKNINIPKKKDSKKKILSYMGVFKLDFKLIKEFALLNLDNEIHIIGNYKNFLNLPNVIFHGYLTYDKYIEILKITDCFIVPYHEEEVNRMKKLGLTSKYYLPMSLGIPILTKSYGELTQNIEKYNIYTYDKWDEAKIKLDFILKNKFKKNEKVDFFLENLKIKNRKKELEKILKEYNII